MHGSEGGGRGEPRPATRLPPPRLKNASGPPRTDPSGRNSRTRLPPRVVNGKARVGPWMKDAQSGQVSRRESSYTSPRGAVLLAAALERTPPQIGHVIPESTQTRSIGRHGVVVKISTYHLRQPLALRRNGVMHAPPQRLLDFPQFGSHPLPA